MRRVKHIYVANWFYGAFIITIAVLHIFNNLAIPVTLTKSYVIYTGVVDAMMQWWYGHNAVGFFLTAGFLGMMYYFVPKQAGRPVYLAGFEIALPDSVIGCGDRQCVAFFAFAHGVRTRVADGIRGQLVLKIGDCIGRLGESALEVRYALIFRRRMTGAVERRGHLGTRSWRRLSRRD